MKGDATLDVNSN